MPARSIHLGLALVLVACGGNGQRSSAARSTVTLDPAAFLTRLGAEASSIFREPERSSDDIDAARGGARGAERRELSRDLVVALLHEADAAEARGARRLRQRADRMLAAARSGNRDDAIAAELDMIDLWKAWRGGSNAQAARLAERFTRRHASAGILTGIAWMVWGEAAVGEEDYREAIAHYRFALGQIGTPLYAFALYRTAHAHRAIGENDEAVQAFDEVERMGCAADATEPVVRVATAAASEQARGLRLDTDGVTRPSVCPSPAERAAQEGDGEGWRPAE